MPRIASPLAAHRPTFGAARPALLALVAGLAVLVGCGPHQAATPADLAAAPSWESTLERITRGVVVLRVTIPREFDTEMSGSYLGTGFIVDAERGIILTNRHLVQPGPVVSEAIFLNHEEVEIHAIYRDPVHDFGFYQYDPSHVQFTDIAEIPLAPAAARVGIDIRVVGNDAGEKLSILGGTLARLDRDAPLYDDLSYNDFNTFYIQAASGTSGGSSGSPVVDIEGRAVALNAGGAFLAESSFFLPLDRVVRALELIQHGEPVARGTLQTIFLRKSYDELRRLGLPIEEERAVREAAPEAVGLLVVDEVVSGGPGDELLEPGDIVTHIDGERATTFVQLEQACDSRIGQPLELSLIRAGVRLQVSPVVGDLHAITPREYVEVGDAIIHPLSYQQARNFHEPVRGLYVARTGYLFGGSVPWGAMLRSIDGEPIETLDALWAALLARKDRDRMRIRYAMAFDSTQEYVSVATLDRRWFSLRRCRRADDGSWPCEEAPPASGVWTPEAASTTIPDGGQGPADALSRSLVMVEYNIPYLIEGVAGARYVGTGLIVDAERGLVVTDRDTVPIGLGDLQLTFGGALRVPGRVEFVHPEHNFAIVSYDPALIGDTPVQSAVLDPAPVTTGDKLWMVARDSSYNLVATEATVQRIAPMRMGFSDPPAFREINLDAIEAGGATKTVGGVLTTGTGKVRALWLSFGMDENGPVFRGLPISLVDRIVAPMRKGAAPAYRSLGVELRTMTLADALEEGLSPRRVDTLKAHPAKRQQVLMVSRRYAGFPAEQALQGGDLILSVDGAEVATFEEIEVAAQRPAVKLVVLREGAEVEVEIASVALGGTTVERVVSWGGMLLHDPHLAVAAQHSTDMNGVFVSWAFFGSPATHYAIPTSALIIAVNGTPTPDLDSFVRAVGGIGHRESVRLQVVDLEGLEQMVTMRLDLEFWPSWQLTYTDGEWTRGGL